MTKSQHEADQIAALGRDGNVSRHDIEVMIGALCGVLVSIQRDLQPDTVLTAAAFAHHLVEAVQDLRQVRDAMPL